ncbi:MAG: hypothetical protein LBC87_04415 [Fibromonadaceae bacterium]|nr:hypothetical protein [Fibromonadaceae bacterium]
MAKIINLKNILIFASIAIVAMSVIVRIIMYIKCRSLWLDEAMLAESIVLRNWLELLTPPLASAQSAPILYVIAVKAIGSIFGYSERSLRIFSFFAFIGLLICEVIFLKKIFNFSNCRIAFVVVMSALLPSYICYSNELKPYMSDAFFVLLTILLYFYYMQNKIKLPVLTVLYILILCFSSPAVFFIGGTLLFEFISAILNKNKKQMLYIAISGITILVVFALYYHWWMSPVSEAMKAYWDDYARKKSTIYRIVFILSDERNIFSLYFYVWFFVPFALLGIYSLCKSKNKIACSLALSLLFAFLASSIGKWPLVDRLWLFLPTIVFIFATIGADIVLNKIKAKNRNIMSAVGFSFLLVITLYLSIICLEFISRDRMYVGQNEINPLISYVQENIKYNEKLYVYQNAIPAFRYKNGYNATKIGNAANNNIIYGTNIEEWNVGILGNDMQSIILENKKIYLLFAHHFGIIDGGLLVLQKYGTLTEIMDYAGTLLLYFERDD